jgi:hypothetical protein
MGPEFPEMYGAPCETVSMMSKGESPQSGESTGTAQDLSQQWERRMLWTIKSHIGSSS